MTGRTEPNTLQGIGWMMLTGLLFVGVTALVKLLGTRIPAAEAAFLRYVLGLVFLIPMWPAMRAARLSARDWRFFGLRGLAHTGGVILWFYAMARIPIADVTAMNYLSPIYVTLGAALFLGEPLAARRLIAIAVAFVGALIILRPGLRELGPGHLAMVFTAMFFGASYLLAKLVSGVGAPVVVAMLSISVTIGLFPFAVMNWVWPTARDLAILSGVALLATAGHYSMTLAFRAAPLSVTQPVTFLQLVWAVLLGALVFGEGVDSFVILGGMIIVCAISYMSWREAVIKRRRITPLPNETKL